MVLNSNKGKVVYSKTIKLFDNEFKYYLTRFNGVEGEEYPYVVTPLTDMSIPVDPSLLVDAANAIKKMMNKGTKIVTAEAQGIQIATTVSILSNIPIVVARRHQYGLPGEIGLRYKTGYEEGRLFLNGVYEDDKVIIIDDVVSTGGTLLSLIEAVKKTGAEIIDIITIFDKEQFEGRKNLEKIGYKVKSLFKLRIFENRVEIVPDKPIIHDKSIHADTTPM